MNKQIKITIAMSTMICLMMAVNANAQPECGYEVVIVHPDPCGILRPPSAGGNGLNSFGHVAGDHIKCSNQFDTAFLWTLETGMVDLQMPDGAVQSQARDVNDNGWIVGWATFSGDDLGRLGFLHDGRSAITMGTLPGGNFSQATAINNAGQVSGIWGNNVVGNPSRAAFIWEDGRMLSLAPDLGTPKSDAMDINAAGDVTGWMGSSFNNDGNAYIWSKGDVTILPPISGGFWSQSRAINNHLDVVGFGRRFDEKLKTNVRRAFLWTNGEMTDLGVLPGRTESFAYGVNDAKQVVGLCWDFGSNGAPFIWQNGVMTNLNDLVPPDFTIASAWAINNQGMIAGAGNGAEGGFPGMALLIPVPRPVGDLDLNCEVDINDLLLLFGEWGTCNGCPADLDENGIVNVSDLLILFSNWG